jgi:hypothetical protein
MSEQRWKCSDDVMRQQTFFKARFSLFFVLANSEQQRQL